MDKSCIRVQGELGAPAPCSVGKPCWWRTASTTSAGMSLWQAGCTQAPSSASGWRRGADTFRLPHLLTLHHEACAVGTLVTSLALHGVAVAPLNGNLAKLETLVLRSVWGATGVAQAKETVFSVLALGHRGSLVMHVCYEHIIWRVVRCLGVTQVFMQVIWECHPWAPADTLVCRPVRTLHSLGYNPMDGPWCWDVPR